MRANIAALRGTVVLHERTGIVFSGTPLHHLLDAFRLRRSARPGPGVDDVGLVAGLGGKLRQAGSGMFSGQEAGMSGKKENAFHLFFRRGREMSLYVFYVRTLCTYSMYLYDLPFCHIATCQKGMSRPYLWVGQKITTARQKQRHFLTARKTEHFGH